MTRPGSARHVFVFEKRPRWEPELKRQLPEYRREVRACRTISQLQSLVREQPHCLLILNLDGAAAECLRVLSLLVEQRLACRAIVVGEPGLAELEWPARELGALDFLPGTVGGPALARLCRRLLAPPPDLAESLLIAMLAAADTPSQTPPPGTAATNGNHPVSANGSTPGTAT